MAKVNQSKSTVDISGTRHEMLELRCYRDGLNNRFIGFEEDPDRGYVKKMVSREPENQHTGRYTISVRTYATLMRRKEEGKRVFIQFLTGDEDNGRFLQEIKHEWLPQNVNGEMMYFTSIGERTHRINAEGEIVPL